MLLLLLLLCACRFSAFDREYKYFIVQDGSLDLGAMQEAASYLVGDHDFRNFCKADVGQVGGGQLYVVNNPYVTTLLVSLYDSTMMTS